MGSMGSTVQTLNQAPEAEVGTGDRLSFTLFLAVALHALLILGISFSSSLNGNIAPTLQITLATHKAEKAPDKADYLAQFNQEASGTAAAAKELATDTPTPFADTEIRDVNPTPQQQAHTPSETQQQQQVTTTAKSSRQAQIKLKPNPTSEQQPREGELQDLPAMNAEIASLQAKLDQQRQAYAKRPRIRRLTSMATKASFDAEYLHRWTSKVEFVGNRNYPKQALADKVFGDLRLATIVRANGTVESVEILQSSGYPLLDNAALQIVRMASPFSPFPPEIRSEYDQLEIIRTWHFEITGLSTTR